MVADREAETTVARKKKRRCGLCVKCSSMETHDWNLVTCTCVTSEVA